MTTPFVRQIDPTTRDVVMDTGRGSWAEAASSELALARSILSTPKGRRLAKPSFGIEWPSKAVANVGAVTRQAILDGFRVYVARGIFRDLVVTAYAEGEACFYDVTFTGRDGQRRTVSGQR